MREDCIPQDVRNFIIDNIDNIAQLEALLLFRANNETAFSVQDIAQRIYISESDSEKIISRFVESKYLTEQPGPLYRYAPSEASQAIIEHVADIYSRFLVPLTHLIHSKNKIQKFADAFRIRKD